MAWPIQKVYKFDQRIQTFEEVDKFSQDLNFRRQHADHDGLRRLAHHGPAGVLPEIRRGSVVEARKMLEALVRSAKSVIVGRHALSDFINADEQKMKFDAIEAEIKTLVAITKLATKQLRHPG